MEAVQKAVDGTSGPVKALVAMLASTGLRINEALAIGLGNTWDPRLGRLQSLAPSLWVIPARPKTKAGKRVVDFTPQSTPFEGYNRVP